MRGACESRFHRFVIAVLIIERNIAGHVVVELRGAVARCFFSRNHRRQRLDIDSDRLGRILGLRQRLSDHASDGIADIAHAIHWQRRATRFFQRRAVAIGKSNEAFERAIIFQVGAGIDREHTRHLRRRFGVDTADDPMRIAAANHDAIDLAGQAHIIRVASQAAHKHGIFKARDGLPDSKFLNCQPIVRRFSSATGGSKQIHVCGILEGSNCL